jgi:uncharacterized membrane protein YphA (DoxX/SURF4 family)
MSGGVFARLASPGLLRAAQILTGIVFLLASLSKLGDLAAFAAQVHNYRILPVWSENLAAMTLPWIELLAGLSLIFRVRPRAGAVVAAALLAVFTLAVGAAWARGLDFECGCFGKASASRIGLQKMLENAALLAVSWLGALRPRTGGG